MVSSFVVGGGTSSLLNLFSRGAIPAILATFLVFESTIEIFNSLVDRNISEVEAEVEEGNAGS